MTRADILAESWRLAGEIVDRGKDQAPEWWMRWGARLAPRAAQTKVQGWIREALGDRHPNFIARIQPAIRIAPRAEEYWQRTRESVLAAGFEEPLIYREPGTSAAAGGLEWSHLHGPIASFKAMCGDLLSRSSAEWLLLLEDDVLLSNHLADYLRRFHLTNEILSLYVSGPRQLDEPGFSTIRRPMVGSLAIVIRRGVLLDLMHTRQWRGWRKRDCVDQLIHRAAAEIGAPIQTHRPSLAQHIGESAAIYKDRTLTNPLRFAADWNQAADWTPPLVTLITPTGDRPEAFRWCEEMMSRQRFTGEIQWIVTDDGQRPTEPQLGQEYYRLRPMRRHSLCRNLRFAIPKVRGSVVLIIEDDDFYSEDYISTMVGRLERAELVGEFGAKYYYVRSGDWRHHVTRENHASLCRTGMRASVLPTVQKVIAGTDHPSVDLRLWRRFTGSTYHWRDPDGLCSLCVGIKGVDGRSSRGWRVTRTARKDEDGSVLRRWVGEAAPRYEALRGE